MNAMNRTRALALVLAVLQLAPVLPVAAATHLSPPLPQGLPRLPEAEPTSQCIGLQLAPEVLARVQDAGSIGFREKEGVPSLCSLDGRPMEEWVAAVRQLDAFLDNYRNLTNELERQYEERLEYAVPQGPCTPGDELTSGVPYACPLLRPQVTLLSDRFDGRRLGGFGEWTVVTDGNAAPAWRQSVTTTLNGTQHTWRFGDDAGYPRSAHQWLVSPQIDLGAVRGDADLAQELVLVHGSARNALRQACNNQGSQVPVVAIFAQLCSGQGGFSVDGSSTLSPRAAFQILIDAYEEAIDAQTRGLAVGQHAATLSLTFRMNLADREDGVRVWAWAGREAPTRVQLFDLQRFGREDTTQVCFPSVASRYVRDLGEASGEVCHQVATEDGAAWLLTDHGLPGLATKAFQSNAARTDKPAAFTGDVRDFVTVDVPLTEFLGQRIWLLFEVATTPDTGRGEDYFGDRARFPRQDDYGFELASVRAVGDAWPRNVRLNDVASAFTRMPAGNPYGDGKDVRTAIPPGQDVVARVHNAGGYPENATLTVRFQENDHDGNVPVGGYQAMGDPVVLRVLNLRPGETREVRVPWPAALREDSLYRVSANLTVDDLRQLPPLSNASAYAEPAATGARPGNQAESDGNATAAMLLRAYTDHRLSARHYPPAETGPALEVCATVSLVTGCDPLYVAGKGERRTLLLGVRNDGSVPEDATAVLDLRLDGVDKASIVQGGVVRPLANLLPGETRPVTWELAPADGGAYRATVYLRLANGSVVGEPVSRLVFVQRSTGLVCFDDLAENRECGTSFSSTRPEGLRGEPITASLLGPDGSLYVATATTTTGGALWRQAPDGEWTLLENLSLEALSGKLAPGRLPFGAVRDLALGPDGTVYMAGDNDTLLARPPAGAGALRAYAWPAEGEPVLEANAGGDEHTVEAGRNATLTGSVDGPGQLLHAWEVVGGPAGGDATLDGTGLTTVFRATVPGAYVVRLTGTNGTATAADDLTVHVVPPVPPCLRQADGSVLHAMLLGTDPVESGLGAADLTCVTLLDSGTNHQGQVHVDVHVANVTQRPENKPVQYVLTFQSQGVTHKATVTWGTTGQPALTPNEPPGTFKGTVKAMPYGLRITFTKGDALLLSESFTLDGVKVESCAVDCTRKDAIGPGTYSLATDLAAPAQVKGVATSRDLHSSHAINVEWAAMTGAAAYRVERSAAPGEWVGLAQVAGTRFRDAGAQTDRPYAYRVLAIDEAGNVGKPSAAATGEARLRSPHHLAVGHWNGTTFVGGVLGRFGWLNETSGLVEPVTLELQRAPSAGTRLTNHVRDLLVSPDGKRLYVALDGGSILLNEGSGAAWRSAGWNETFTPYPHAYDVLALAAHDGKVYAAGRGPDGGVLLHGNETDAFRRVQAPEVAGRVPGLVGLASAPDGRLFVATTDETAPLAACEACPDPTEWAFPAIPLPTIAQDDVVRRASVVAVLGGVAGRTVALAEGGVVLEYARRGAYANDGDWSVQPTLRVNDGAAYEAMTTAAADQILRFEPLSSDLSQGWSRLRVTADHHVAAKSGADLRIRVFYLPFPNANPTLGTLPAQGNTCAAACAEQTLGVVGAEKLLRKPSNAGGWETTVIELDRPRQSDTGAETLAAFTGVEFFIPKDGPTNWAVDDVRVEGLFPGGWREILSWHGPQRANAAVVANSATSSVGVDWKLVKEPFRIDTVSAWHLSQDLAERPVWVLNNEVYPGAPGGAAARLLNGWDTRLVSPVIDLSEAYDPVVTFRHAYAFKLRIYKDNAQTKLDPADGGWVELQYEKKGEECYEGAAPTVRCWSAFTTICPDMPGDPEANQERFPALPPYCKAGTGYPRMKDMGFGGAIPDYTVRTTDPYGHPIAFERMADAAASTRPSASFWGRSVLPDPTGVITGVRDTTQYEEVQITLRNQAIVDEEGKPVDIAGRRVRVGFHAITTSSTGEKKWDYQDEYQLGNTPTTFPGEGWYITDFKVRGAEQLGLDLRATNMTLEVGYEWVTLGVGPGTRVPVNVTVENRGQFEVGGYTGRLEVRRVVDAAMGITEAVGAYALPQQPALDPGKARNHTLTWPVPDEEGARYLLAFTVTPVGIARDEDFTDNVARIGSLADPVEAATRPGYGAQVLASPADATKDITRYLAILLQNTGNVVLGDAAEGQQGYFRVTRRIEQMGTQEPGERKDCAAWREQVRVTGRTGPLVDCRTWNTTVPVNFGATVALASVSNEFNPSTDLFWKPPTSADYRITVDVELLRRPMGEAAAADDGQVTLGMLLPPLADARDADLDAPLAGAAAERLVRSFDTYLFDDAELGPRGFAIKGEWEFEPGWSEQEPGFRSTKSYGVGDPVLLRFTADVDTSLVTPTVDLGTARSARFAIYHRYKFEPGYDGGVIEASVDGGKTWRRLTPIADDLNGQYAKDHPLAATSPLHLTGDPADKTHAFTGDSSALPQATDGWVLSVFDLTEFSEIAQEDVPYEMYDAGALANYQNRGAKEQAGPGGGKSYPTASNSTYFDATWNVGRLDAYRYWETQNLTEDAVTPRGGPGDEFWWSGSMTLQDDLLRPVENTWLTIDVREALERVEDGDRVVVDWWEWLDRTRLGPDKFLADEDTFIETGERAALRPWPNATRGAFTWNDPAALTNNYHINVTPPSVLERNGNWMRLQSDITDWVRQKGNLEPIREISFVYSPVKKAPTYDPGDPANAESVKRDANETGRYTERWLDDRGFIVDEFTIRASKVVGGQEFDARVLMDEDQAWANAVLQRCALNGAGKAEPDWNDDVWVKLPCTNSTGQYKEVGGNPFPRAPATPVWGRTWVQATYLPGVEGEWQVVDVKDINGKRWDALPATGEKPRAWYTGPICDGDLTPAQADAALCLLPGEETRLVTPAFDLSTIAGTSADLTFTHRYGFHIDTVDGGRHPFASGGAVEIQEFDPQTGTWSQWRQLYANPGAIYHAEGEPQYSDKGAVARLGPVTQIGNPLDQKTHGPVRGGYSAYTVNDTRDSTGRTVRHDSPFQPIRHYDAESRTFTDVQFLYSGSSALVTKNPENGWERARFPLTDYLGKTVRIGFHVAVSAAPRDAQAAPRFSLQNPDGPLDGVGNYDKGGWWVTDVAVVGKVLHGAPVQLRARAATDGNVHEGHWQIDDVGIFGSHYGQNAGIFHDATRAYGGMEGRNVTIPITIRNLGEVVRDNLAIEVRELSTGAKRLRLEGANGTLRAEHLRDNPDVLRLSGYTLAPGQSAVALVNVTVLPGLAKSRDADIELYVELKEYNALERTFQKIAFNEVQGFLKLRIPFTAERFPQVRLDAPRLVSNATGAGQPLVAAIDVRNDGFETVRLNLTCQADLVTGFTPEEHGRVSENRRTVAASYPCAPASGPGNLTPGQKATVTFRVTPDREGALHLRFAGGSHVGDQRDDVAGAKRLVVLVGSPPVLYQETFSDAQVIEKAWTADSSSRVDGSTGPEWSYARGRGAPGAMLLGLNESRYSENSGYNTLCSNVCKAVTKPFDFHNFTDEDLQLTFWHMDRLARHDGAQVSWQVLIDETRPNLANSWSDAHCVLDPRGGYDSPYTVESWKMLNQGEDPDDTIPYPEWENQKAVSPSPGKPALFFSSESFEDDWSYAAFDLREQSCKAVRGSSEEFKLLGHTVRFVFAVYAGLNTAGHVNRGHGQGWLVDDVALSLSRLSMRPETPQRALLLDNSTKGFHLVLSNLAAQPDLVKLEVDEGNSSAPAGAIQVPAQPVAIGARTLDQHVRVNVTLPRDPSLLPTQYRARVIARSVLDPTTFATADFTLDFQPRQWAELAVSATPPPLAVQEGTETFLPITVENNGVVASTPSVVRITDAWPGGVQVTELDLPSMPSYFQDAEDALRVLDFRWRPAKGSIGMHTLTFEVDPKQLGEEYTRQNNVLTLQVPVAELLLPDVDVAAADALRIRDAVGRALVAQREGGVTRYESAAGELVTLEVKVRNPGRAAATNVDVRAFLGPLSLPAKTLPYLGPGEEASLTFNWVAQKGEYPLEVVARSEQVETNAANNRNPATGVSILVVKGFEVRVQMPDLDGILEPGTDVKVEFNVSNVGNAGEEIRLASRVPDGWNATVSRDALFLRAGETFAATLTVRVPAHAVAGEHFISVDATARDNPMKAATASAKAFVRAFYGGSLDDASARGAPPTLTLPLTLRNEGNSLEPWSVVLQLPPGWTTVEPQPLRPVVPAHGETTVALRLRVPESTPPGERQLGVKVTLPDGSRRDGVARVDVRELRAAVASVADDRPREAQGALAYPVVLQNAGNVARPFDLVLLQAPDGVEARIEPSRFEIAPGAKAVATLVVKPKPGVAPGAYQVSAFASFEGVPPDTPEGRANLQRLQVSVVRPDLRAGQLEHAKAGVEAGERVVVKVPVHNDGQATVTDLPVHLFVDDVFMGETRIARLAPGEKRDVTLNWTARPGEHTVTAVVDPWKDTVDPDATDNAVSAVLDVESSAVGGLVGGARVPAPGLFLLALAALAAALVVTPKTGARRPPR